MPNLVAYDLAAFSNERSYRTDLRNALPLQQPERNRGILQRGWTPHSLVRILTLSMRLLVSPTLLLVWVLLPSLEPILLFSTLLAPPPRPDMMSVKAWSLVTLRTLDLVLATISTKWRSTSRRSPLLRSPGTEVLEYASKLCSGPEGIHGLNAEAELANILTLEILAEINREMIRTIYKIAEQGAAVNTATAGTFDLDIDSNGRWSVEKFKGLIFQIERDANQIAQRTRRGKGNIILCSADVASALTMGWCT